MQIRTTNQIRLHYRDVSALINLIENDYDIAELNSEEQHAYFRLREMRAALESYEAHKSRKALLNSNEANTLKQKDDKDS